MAPAQTCAPLAGAEGSAAAGTVDEAPTAAEAAPSATVAGALPASGVLATTVVAELA
jgi:hypothetical protein